MDIIFWLSVAIGTIIGFVWVIPYFRKLWDKRGRNEVEKK